MKSHCIPPNMLLFLDQFLQKGNIYGGIFVCYGDKNTSQTAATDFSLFILNFGESKWAGGVVLTSL